MEIGWLGKLSGKLWELPWELLGLLGQLPGQSGARAVVKRNTDFDKWAQPTFDMFWEEGFSNNLVRDQRSGSRVTTPRH